MVSIIDDTRDKVTEHLVEIRQTGRQNGLVFQAHKFARELFICLA